MSNEAEIILIKDLANITPGYPFRGKITESTDSDILAVQMKDVSIQEGIDWQISIRTELKGKKKPQWLTAGDILFVARGTNNTAIYVDASANNYKSVAAPQFFIIKCNTEKVLPQYLAWYINQPTCQRYFQSSSEGTLHKSIRRSVLEDCPIAIPSLEQQQHIIHLANTLDQEKILLSNLIDNNAKIMATLAYNLSQGNRRER